MGKRDKPPIGSIAWSDLTINNAETVKEFYSEVAGWQSQPLDMGGYDDYCMVAPSTGATVAGICHARGVNANLPPRWLIYITVDDLDRSVERCLELGGSVVDGPRKSGEGRFCVIRDPAGAVAALVAQ